MDDDDFIIQAEDDEDDEGDDNEEEEQEEENEIVDFGNDDDEPLVASVEHFEGRGESRRYGDHSKIRNRSRRTVGSIRV